MCALHPKISSSDVNPMQKVPPALSTGLAPFPSQPVRIESHPAAEVAPGCENPPKSHWQSLDSPLSFAAPQKELWACLPPALESRQARRPRKSSPHPKAPGRSRPPTESPCDWIPPLHDTCSHKIIAARTPETNRSADPASHAKPFEPATPSAPAPTYFVRDLIRSLLQCLAHLLFATLVRRAPRARSRCGSRRFPKKVLPRFRPERTNNTAPPNTWAPTAALAPDAIRTRSTTQPVFHPRSRRNQSPPRQKQTPLEKEKVQRVESFSNRMNPQDCQPIGFPSGAKSHPP